MAVAAVFVDMAGRVRRLHPGTVATFRCTHRLGAGKAFMSMMPGAAKDAVQHHGQEHQAVNQSGHGSIFSNEESSIRAV